MKRSVFNIIKDNVCKSSVDSAIWWAGYIWLDLTDGQFRTLIPEFDKLSFILKNHTDNQLVYILPSGMELRIDRGDY